MLNSAVNLYTIRDLQFFQLSICDVTGLYIDHIPTRTIKSFKKCVSKNEFQTMSFKTLWGVSNSTKLWGHQLMGGHQILRIMGGFQSMVLGPIWGDTLRPC